MHAVYDELPEVVGSLGLDHVDAVFFDLGVSSMQLDVRDRGFAYSEDAPLDMRMDPTTGRTAAELLNTATAQELTRILREYGEEKFASKIAREVVRRRETHAVHHQRRPRRAALRDRSPPRRGVRAATPPSAPSRRCGWRSTTSSPSCAARSPPPSRSIGVGGRVVVESYHSLEDRLVKRAFADATRLDVPPDLPFVPEGAEPALRLVTRGAEQADEHEIAENPRAASVRLRAVERVLPVLVPLPQESAR